MNNTPLQIHHNLNAQRFEVIVDGYLCVADYRMRDGVMEMTHTFVDPALQGRGIAAQLVVAALAYAREHKLKVAPLCSYVHAYFERQPEVQDLRV